MKNFSKEELENLGIYELRNVSRNIGVKSPTTKKRDELIEQCLKIQRGEEKAVVSNKGRKPKSLTSYINKSNEEILDSDNICKVYSYSNVLTNSFAMSDCESIDCVNNVVIKVYGIIREFDSKLYLYNYSNSYHIVRVSEKLINSYMINKGDFIEGSAFVINDDVAELSTIDNLNFKNNNKECLEETNKFEICSLTNTNTILQKLDYNKKLNVVLEIETDGLSILNYSKKAFFIHTEEVDDIRKSINSLLDTVSMLKNLKNSNTPYTLFICDIDYIFSILNAYSMYIGGTLSVDAGQFIKQIMANVKESVFGNCIIFEKGNYKRDAYLDAILNKYL